MPSVRVPRGNDHGRCLSAHHERWHECRMMAQRPASARAKPRLIRLGCAGWSLPAAVKGEFHATGSHLTRYASRFNAVEINSSFYRPHQPATYAKWAGSVPAGFRFSVKLPKAITHEHKLAGVGRLLKTFLGEVACLGDKLGCLLAQLPPSLEYKPAVATRFFTQLRTLHAGPVVLEPRHPSWFADRAEAMLLKHRIGRVAADPATIAPAAHASGWPDTVYYRLHGSPRMYYSSYEQRTLTALANDLLAHAARPGTTVWCIFDNTASGAAIPNALQLARNLESLRHPARTGSAARPARHTVY
jgi:uncharacterized protein YecE (DUF72 family)